MKSKIKIDLDGQNNPVLRIELSQDQEDLRDKALKRLIEGIGFDSNSLFIRERNFPYADSDQYRSYDVYPFIQIQNTVQWGDHASMMMRFEAEILLAESLGFKVEDISNGIKIWKDADGNLWRWEKYGFGQLERKGWDHPKNPTESFLDANPQKGPY